MNFSNLSRKFCFDSGILQLMEDLGKASDIPVDIQMLGAGNPAAIPQMQIHFREEMERIMATGNQFERMTGYYDAPQGNLGFIASLAQLLTEEFGWPVSEQNIAVTNGSQSSITLLFNLFSGVFPDGLSRKVMFPMIPEYIGYSDVSLSGTDIFDAVRPGIDIDSYAEEPFFKYIINFDDLNLKDEHGALCVSRPNNPTGNVITNAEIAGLCSVAGIANIPLIIDGAYGLPFPSIVFNDATPVWDNNIILCLSLSKLGLPGVRTGIVVAAREVIEIVKGATAIFSLAPGRFGPTLVKQLVLSRKLLDLCRNVIRPYYQLRVQQTVALIREIMVDIPVKIHKPEGAIFLWLWFPNLPITSEELYIRLKNKGVFVVSGHHFFPGFKEPWKHTQECIRISYAADWDQLVTGFHIIADEVKRAYGQ